MGDSDDELEWEPAAGGALRGVWEQQRVLWHRIRMNFLLMSFLLYQKEFVSQY